MARILRGYEDLEAARKRMAGRSFAAGLFFGVLDVQQLLDMKAPSQDPSIGEKMCEAVESFLRKHVDPLEIERTAQIPERVLTGLFKLGAMRMAIPEAYGGLGFSNENFARVIMRMAGWSNILALTVAVHQSIGMEAILRFGTEDQRRTYLPRMAEAALTAFALTEPITGSDASHVETTAVLDPEGTHFIANGEKLYTTNGPIATYATMVARVPARQIRREGKLVWEPVSDIRLAERRAHTAFVIDMGWNGIVIRQRCAFEGCRGIANAHVTLSDVRIPRENVIGDIGSGLRYALTILNTGRAISIPAISLGMAKQAWLPALAQANNRVTFGRPIGLHRSQTVRLGKMAANLFAMESLARLVWRMADRPDYDPRIEAAVAKVFCSETAIQFLRDVQILFGGAGYETADSKKQREEPAFPAEQLVRDIEMYRIGEGATDILRSFIAREGLAIHLEQAKGYLGAETRLARTREFLALAGHYLPWYLAQWKSSSGQEIPRTLPARIQRMLRYAADKSRQLARVSLYALGRQREAFEQDQGRQHRIAMLAEQLLVVSAVAWVSTLRDQEKGKSGCAHLADECLRTARGHFEGSDSTIQQIMHAPDTALVTIGLAALHGEYDWLADGVPVRRLDGYR